MMRQTVRILMESVTEEVDLDAVVRETLGVQGVQDIRHVHVWELDEEHRALEAHVVIEWDDLAWMEHVKRELTERLQDAFGIGHTTLGFEIVPKPSVAVCDDRSIVPHADT